MARVYRTTFENILVSAAQDLVTLLLPTSAANFKQIDIVRYWVGCTDSTIPTAQMLSLRLRWLPATVTVGTGGSAGTVVQEDQGDSAAKCTTRTNDSTSKSSTSGTAVILDEQTCHIYNGFDSASTGQDPFPVPCNNTLQQAVVWELLSTVTGTVHLSGGIEFSEAG